MDKHLLEILVCPTSGSPLIYRKKTNELWCKESRLAYSIHDDIPVLLPEKARKLEQAELDELT